MRDLAGKAAFVTGAASGIGLAIAQACAAEGMKVVLADIDESTLGESADALGETGAEVMAFTLDVTDRDRWARAAAEVPAAMGPVQLLVNNAGISTNGLPIDEIAPELWDRVIDIDLTGAYNGVHTFLDGMRSAGGGHIVNTSSVGGLVGSAKLAPYCAAKAALIGLSEALRAELAPSGIGVSVLCPGGVRTRLWRTSRAARGLPDTETPPDDASGQSARAEMLPDDVARRVIAGVRNDEPYIMTHTDARGYVEQLYQQRLEAFDRAAAFS
jgi:NAD(P)-dependent dehydrogenase (short-subunit alcohol dehydrogenase family)